MRRLGWHHSDRRLFQRGWETLRYRALERDGYRCRADGEHGGRLSVHHIRPLRAGGRDEPDNLITLCRKHHEEAERSVDMLVIELLDFEHEGYRIERIAGMQQVPEQEWVRRVLTEAITRDWPDVAAFDQASVDKYATDPSKINVESFG